MHATPPRPAEKTSARLNPMLCAGALARLFWSCGALALLWLSVYWALS
jgi:hypothetical protein